jgi:hypothetical protein
MNERIGLATALSASVILAFTAGAALTHAARADNEAVPNSGCSSTLPCLTKSNTSSGPGIKSTSDHGTGLAATTNAKGSTSGNGASAILGRDIQSANGQFNAGVTGTSKNGVGVQGTSGGSGMGVRATSQQGTGIQAVGSVGVSAFGSFHAVDAETSGDVAVFAHNTNSSSSALVFRGDNNNGNTVFSVDNSGHTTIAGSIEAPFQETINFIGGIQNETISANAGIQTNGPNFGVYAEVVNPSSSATGYFSLTDNPQAWLYQGASVFHNRIDFEVADDGTVFGTGFGTISAPRVAQKTSTGRSIDTYTPQTSQPTLEDFGEAQLVDGVANVALDATFGAAINRTAGYLVSVTPEGDCRGLFVAQRTGTGFSVRELQGGRSSIAFVYHIVAKPYGNTSARLPASSMPRNFGAPLDPKLLPAQVSRPLHADPVSRTRQ